MAKATKDLTVLNSTLPLPVFHYWNGGGSVQYGTGGAGTVVLEATLDEWDEVVDGTAQWSQIQMKNPNDIAGAPISSLAAAGLGVFDVVGYRAVRVRKSVGGASCVVTLVVGAG